MGTWRPKHNFAGCLKQWSQAVAELFTAAGHETTIHTKELARYKDIYFSTAYYLQILEYLPGQPTHLTL